MAASCMSSRPVSCFSSTANFFESSRVPSNVSRIFTNARITKDAHLHGTRAVEDVRGLECPVFCENIRTVLAMLTSAFL